MSAAVAERIAYLQTLGLLNKVQPVVQLAAQLRAGGLRLVADATLAAALTELANAGDTAAQSLLANIEVQGLAGGPRKEPPPVADLDRAIGVALSHLPDATVTPNGRRLRRHLEALRAELAETPEVRQ